MAEMRAHMPEDDAAPIEERSFEIETSDGVRLAAQFIAPPAPRWGVLISGATGIPATFYARFARQGAARGAAVLLYDYRGMGASEPSRLKGYEADITDWGRRDMSAALDMLARLAPDRPLRGLGHSVGGHMLGFAPNNTRLERHAFVCAGSGYWGKHRFPSPLRELFFWYGYGPACLALFGYIPAGGLWGGSALAKPYYLVWRRWCLNPRFFFDELKDALSPNVFDAVTAPIRSFVYADDPIATPETAREILACYPNAQTELVERAPADYGLAAIGHNGPFRRAHAPAAEELWDWLLGAG